MRCAADGSAWKAADRVREGVVRPDPADEIRTDERCFILELAGAAADPEVSIARARVPRGTTTALHRLKGVDERYVVLEGRGRVEVGARSPTEVGPGDVVLIPRGTAQRIANTGDGELVFLCVCTPAFTPDCYEGLE